MVDVRALTTISHAYRIDGPRSTVSGHRITVSTSYGNIDSIRFGEQIMDLLNPAQGRVGLTKENPNMSESVDGSHRVVFTFDPGSYKVLQELTKELNLGSDASTIREALRIIRAIQTQADEGYSDVIVQNPNTFDQKKLIIPVLENRRNA
jgi:hypothetical protein